MTDRPPEHARPGDRAAGLERRRRLVALGVGAAALAATLLATLHALATPPFAPPDETSHVGYALAVTDGRRPSVAEFPDAGRIPYMRDGLSMWTANHPPLYHLLAGAPLRLGEAAGRPLAGLWVARLVSAASAGAGVLLVGCLGVLLLPRRPALAVAAAGVAGLPPYLVHTSGIAYSDAFGFLTTTTAVVAATILLRRGPAPLRLALVAGAGAVAAVARVSGLLALALAAGAAAVAPMLHGAASWPRRLARGAAHAGLVAAVALVTAGWFYLDNLWRYGDLTGSRALLELFGREPRGDFLPRLVNRGFWRDVHTQLWSRTETASRLPDVLLVPFRWWVLAIAAGLLLALARRLARGGWRPGAAPLAAWAPALLLLAGTVVAFLRFVGMGGSAHARYLFPAAGALGIVAALGLGALPGRRRGIPAAACTLSLLVANLVVLYRHARDTSLYGPVLAVKRLVLDGGAGLVVLATVTLALLGACFVAYAVALWRLGPSSLEAPRRGAGPGRLARRGGTTL